MEAAEVWQMLSMFLGGAVASGIALIIRGDFLGKKAAEEVELRLNSRIDREMFAIGEDFKEVKATLLRIEDKLVGGGIK